MSVDDIKTQGTEKMEKCIANYKKAKSNIKEKHNAEYCKFSTLQYFEEYIYDQETKIPE